MSANPPRDRKCATCRHYQQSPLWRKGWCRNPLLFDPNTNHLVEAESLSCKRAFIDYWEARAAGDKGIPPTTAGERPRVSPAIQMAPTAAGGAPLRGNGNGNGNGRTATAQAFAPAPTRERSPLSLIRPGGLPAEAPAPPPGQLTAMLPAIGADPEFNAAPTTVMRIQGIPTPAPPPPVVVPSRLGRGVALGGAVGLLLLLLGLFYGPALAKGLPSFGKPTVTPLPPTATVVALVIPPTETPLPPPPDTPVPLPTAPPPPPAVIFVGGFAVVTGTDSGRLNVRSLPSTSKGKVLAKVDQGTRLQIVAGPQNDGKRDWWQVIGWDSKSTPAWASADYLKPVP